MRSSRLSTTSATVLCSPLHYPCCGCKRFVVVLKRGSCTASSSMQAVHAAGQLSTALHSSRAVQPVATALQPQLHNTNTPNTRVQQQRHAQQQRRLISCKAAKQKQQPKRDQPDMGRRSSRKVKIPTPEELLNPTNGPKTPDPDSQGFQERALLMAYLENLDPEMRDQFAQYMDMQVQKMEQQQDVSHAAGYMQVGLLLLLSPWVRSSLLQQHSASSCHACKSIWYLDVSSWYTPTRSGNTYLVHRI